MTKNLQGITFTDSLDGITPVRLAGFFVGWSNPPRPTTHLRLLQNSSTRLLAIDDETGQVVGFINALSDGVLSAFIPFLEVLPAFQGRGIGAELTRLMLAHLDHLYAVDLLCDPEVQPFYARLGLVPAHGMARRRYERQDGEGR